jgi:hypothetical protein
MEMFCGKVAKLVCVGMDEKSQAGGRRTTPLLYTARASLKEAVFGRKEAGT